MTPQQKLQTRLSELGVEPDHKLGQNFLIEPVVIERILQACRKTTADKIIEIGPGLGALTDGLKLGQAPLTLIELDRDFAKFWRGQEMDTVEADALQVNWTELTRGFKNVLLVSNLPYQISSSLVIDRALGPTNVRSMILMFQKEVAQRLMAKPSTEDYGLLSVLAQTFFKMEKVVDASPQSFYPAPKVASRVLAFERRSETGLFELSEPGRAGLSFLKFVKAGFAHRRKLLIGNLSAVHPRPQLEQVWQNEKVGAKVRAEELTPAQFVQLWNALHRSGR